MDAQASKLSEGGRPSLGANLRALRSERGWNLSRLAEATGLPQSTLSKVENGQMSLNYEKLFQVAEALEVDIARLFTVEPGAAPRAMARRAIDRHSDRGFGIDGYYRFKHLSTELKNRLMAPLLIEVSAPKATQRRDEAAMMNLVGERFAYVLEGPVDFLCAQYKTVTLQTGDCVYVDADMPHGFLSPPGVRARILTVLSSADPEYLKLVREAAMRGEADASGRFKALRASRSDQED